MKNVILDTDIYNEIDDQFALAYLLKSKNELNIDAITIAPFSKGEYTPSSSIDKSYETALKIFELCNESNNEIIYKGSRTYFKDYNNQQIEAIDKIIQLALKNKLTYILSIGCITNIAIAIKKEPKIKNRIKIVWLGTNFLFMKNDDFNFRQDVEAIKYVLKSKVDITIIPTHPVSYSLMISEHELKYRIKNKNKLCDYFCEIFTKDYGTTLTRRPIWDISVIAYVINEYWFNTFKISTPKITKNNFFKLTKLRKKITFVQNLNSTKIYDDLFKKIGDNYGN